MKCALRPELVLWIVCFAFNGCAQRFAPCVSVLLLVPWPMIPGLPQGFVRFAFASCCNSVTATTFFPVLNKPFLFKCQLV